MFLSKTGSRLCWWLLIVKNANVLWKLTIDLFLSHGVSHSHPCQTPQSTAWSLASFSSSHTIEDSCKESVEDQDQALQGGWPWAGNGRKWVMVTWRGCSASLVIVRWDGKLRWLFEESSSLHYCRMWQNLMPSPLNVEIVTYLCRQLRWAERHTKGPELPEALRSRERGGRKRREDPRQRGRRGKSNAITGSLSVSWPVLKAWPRVTFYVGSDLVVTVSWECAQTHQHEKERERCKADQRSDQGPVM